MRPAPGRPLRSRLFLLAASGLLPLAIVACVVLAYLVGQRARDAQESALAVSRALATAVDAELRATVSVLQSLVLSDDLAPGQLPEFRALAARVAASQGWRTVVLADAHGKVLMSSAFGLDAAAPAPVDVDSMQRAIAQRQPVVGAVVRGPHEGTPAYAVRVPVARQGKLQYVLSAVIPSDRIVAVLLRQAVPASSLASVFDHHLTRVARSRPGPGEGPTPSLQALLASDRSEGTGPTTSLEGTPSYTGFSRLQPWGWTVTIGIPSAGSTSGVYGAAGAVAGGLLASLALAALAAWYFSRDVIEPIDTLKAAAGARHRGAAPRRRGRPQQGRIPGDARPRVAQPAGAHGHRAAPDGAQRRSGHARRARSDGTPGHAHEAAGR